MLIFNETNFNLGNVKYNDIVTRKVSITNNSTENATLTPSFSSCGCTTGAVTKDKLQPLEVGEFIISFSSVKAGIGSNMSKTIALKYKFDNSETTFEQSFKLKVNVIQ